MKYLHCEGLTFFSQSQDLLNDSVALGGELPLAGSAMLILGPTGHGTVEQVPREES